MPPRPAGARPGLRAVLRFAGLFLLWIALLYASVRWLLPGVQAAWDGTLARLTAWMSRGFLEDDIVVAGATLRSGAAGVEIRFGCNALESYVLFLAAALSFPASWRRRLLGVLAAFPILFAVNQVRLVSLMVLSVVRPDLLEMAHVIVWQTLMVLLVVALFQVLVAGGRLARR